MCFVVIQFKNRIPEMICRIPIKDNLGNVYRIVVSFFNAYPRRTTSCLSYFVFYVWMIVCMSQVLQRVQCQVTYL